MTEVVAHFTNSGSPLTAPAVLPLVDIRRTDTGALVTSAATMFELGGGSFRYTFPATPTLEYSARADGDPTGANSLPLSFRYAFGAFSGIWEERIEVDIPQILTEISSLPAANDLVLSAAHGGGAWDGITDIVSIATAVNSELSGIHGAGSWLTATGFAVPGDNMGLLPTAIDSAAVSVNSLLSGVHGAGSWLTGIGIADWTVAERNELRFVLGITGTQSTPGGGGQVQAILADTAAMQPFVDSTISGVPTAVDSVLSGAHGPGLWDAAGGTDASSTAAAVNSILSGSHGAGSWETATASIVMVGLENQGYTGIRAGNLDNLDLAISFISSQIAAQESQDFFNFPIDVTGVTTVTFLQATQEVHAMLTATIIRSLGIYTFLDRGGVATRLRLQDDDPSGRTRLLPELLSIPNSWGGA